jgi:CBS domain-containing protein
MLVKQIMSQPVAACQINDTLNQAAQLMWEQDCGVVPIVDESGRAVAMLTDRDICMAAYTQGRPISEISVRTAMSQGLYACGPDDPVTGIEELMREHQFQRIPVLNPEGQLLGILSLNAVALAAHRQQLSPPGSPNGVSRSSTARTLAAVCAHRIEAANRKLA